MGRVSPGSAQDWLVVVVVVVVVVVLPYVASPVQDPPPPVSELTDCQQDVATMRTLTIGDRTISYDAGLDSLQAGTKSGEAGGNQ